MTDTVKSTRESLKILAKKKKGTYKEPPPPAPKKKPKYNWVKGQPSANPLGRPKGSKNKTTLLREAVIEGAEMIVLDNLEEIVKTTVKLAKEGDPTCLKIVWDRVIPAKRSIEQKEGGEDKLNISIVIKGMEDQEDPIIESDTIEAEFEEIDG